MIPSTALALGLIVVVWWGWKQFRLREDTRELRWQFACDDRQRITNIVDPGGKRTLVSYEPADVDQPNRVVRELADKSKVVVDFDKFGRRQTLIDSTGTNQYTWNQFNQLAEVRRGNKVISFGWDTADRLTSINHGSGGAISYAYDFLGRLEKITTPGGIISYEYRPGEGLVTRSLPNGFQTVWEYQPDGHIHSITHRAANGGIHTQYIYSYGPSGLIEEITESSPLGHKLIRYEYDQGQRLASIDDSQTGKATFRYDELGNRIRIDIPGCVANQGSFDWAGRLRRYNGQVCTHDLAGNLTSYSADNGKNSFEFDAMNLLESAATSKGKTRYRYDGDGNLVERITESGTTTYVPDPLANTWRPLEASDGHRPILYVWDGSTPLAAISGGETHFFLHDHLGSIRLSTNQKGGVATHFDYSAFGVPAQSGQGRALWPGFAGLFYDPQASLYITRIRAYAPDIARFLQPDPQQAVPFASQESLSRYSYCGNDPVNFVDLVGAQRNYVDAVAPYLRMEQAYRRQQEFYTRIGYPEQGLQQNTMTVMPIVLGSHLLLRGLPLVGLGSKAEPFHFPALPNLRMPSLVKPIQYLLPTVGADPSRPIRSWFGNPHIGWSEWGLHLAQGSQHFFPLQLRFYDSATKVESFLAGGALNRFAGNFAANFGAYSPQLPGVLMAARSGTSPSAGPSATRSPNLGFSTIPVSVSTDTTPRPGIPPPPPPSSGALVPANVGGVYLRGAANALVGMDNLTGVVVDNETGHLVLLAHGKANLDLPALRLDDIVTIFRNVYDYGESPFVSIDPDSKNPSGPIMHIRHGPGTTNTYVGWVLFEADRVMKAYSLGRDNITKQDVNSKIFGYKALFDLNFSNFQANQQASIWERFWIVPASVTQRETESRTTAFLDVPLRVNTQRMVMRNGHLETAPNPTPSPFANAFSQWFTRYYQGLAQEVRSTPPKESGMTEPVSIFDELRRIAVISAVAERLQAQGVDMPAWMREYPVKPFPMPDTTPSLVVRASRETDRAIQRTWTYGGVNLSPETGAIKVAAATPEEQTIARAALQATATAPVLKPVPLKVNNQDHQALAIPGNGSKDLGACQLSETDLILPIVAQNSITMTRKFHSFFQPDGILGRGWTDDLPRLERRRRTTRRVGDKVEYTFVYKLTSPLCTFSEDFTERRGVPEVKAELLVPKHSTAFLGLGATTEEKTGLRAHVLLFRDGKQWFFEEAGNLIAIHQAPITLVYRRDSSARLQKVEGWYGNTISGTVEFAYDERGRLRKLIGSDKQTVTYAYSDDGRLNRVQKGTTLTEYDYQDGSVAKTLLNGKVERQFEYLQNGQLKRESDSTGVWADYTSTTSTAGVRITRAVPQAQSRNEEADYNAAMQPIRRVLEDGTRCAWQYGKDGSVQTRVSPPDGLDYISTYSGDGRHAELHTPEGASYSAESDAAGRVVALYLTNHPVLTQEWRQDGQLRKVSTETSAEHYEYQEDGTLRRILIAPPSEASEFTKWMEVGYDQQRRVERVSDHAGSDVKLAYDSKGQVARVDSNGAYVSIRRGDTDVVEQIDCSWGYQQKNSYNPAGELDKVQITNKGKSYDLQMANGHVSAITAFDGGITRFSYDEGKVTPARHLKRVETPTGVKLSYDYDQQGRLQSVESDRQRVLLTYDGNGLVVGIAYRPVAHH